MGSAAALLAAYLVGGVTFVPLLVLCVLLHAHLTSPYRPDVDDRGRRPSSTTADADDDEDGIVQQGDDVAALEAARKLEKEETRAAPPPLDVAAGYFAVCREYTPMGINAKPIERPTPVGTATVAAPSPSVYQTMYRSIFERKQSPSPVGDKNGSGRPKRAGNVFYVVLRHGHLMLFDDDEQLEVRHVISLAHHEISLYSGGEETPEGELFIKRNAIRLARHGPELGAPDGQVSKPFFLFSENCSAKEDFYFALLRNREQTFPEHESPTPQQFDVRDIIALVQRLHSAEDGANTRWLNALLGRVFLGLYRTRDMENYIREKITKKISRVKRPSFLSGIVIRRVDTGDAAPIVTNPRLRDLTVEGECVVEADVRYQGNFRIEVATTARIDLGSRFKVREVNLVLAVLVRKVEGHVLFKIKPPPSNRIWFSFEKMPKLELTIEPIVSARQITYTLILRQIENRIKEVVAESVVQPFWDDVPFFPTMHKRWRGGIFRGDDAVLSGDGVPAETAAAQEGLVDEVDRLEDGPAAQAEAMPGLEKSHSVPVLEARPATGLFGRRLTSRSLKQQHATSSGINLDGPGPSNLASSSKTSRLTKQAAGSEVSLDKPPSSSSAMPPSPNPAPTTPSRPAPYSAAMSSSATALPRPSLADSAIPNRPSSYSAAIPSSTTAIVDAPSSDISAPPPSSSSETAALDDPHTTAAPPVDDGDAPTPSDSGSSLGHPDVVDAESAPASSTDRLDATPQAGADEPPAEQEDDGSSPDGSPEHRGLGVVVVDADEEPVPTFSLRRASSRPDEDGSEHGEHAPWSTAAESTSAGDDVGSSSSGSVAPQQRHHDQHQQQQQQQQQHQQPGRLTALVGATSAVAAAARRWAMQQRNKDGSAGGGGVNGGVVGGGRRASDSPPYADSTTAGAENTNPNSSASSTIDLSQPMGRGRPLPPPGTPLPPPDRRDRRRVMSFRQQARPVAVAPPQPPPPPPLPNRPSSSSVVAERRVSTASSSELADHAFETDATPPPLPYRPEPPSAQTDYGRSTDPTPPPPLPYRPTPSSSSVAAEDRHLPTESSSSLGTSPTPPPQPPLSAAAASSGRWSAQVEDADDGADDDEEDEFVSTAPRPQDRVEERPSAASSLDHLPLHSAVTAAAARQHSPSPSPSSGSGEHRRDGAVGGGESSGVDATAPVS